MEFPELGVHCAEPSCSRLDFLPFTCDACHKIYCLDHKTYEEHKCTESYLKDVQVPVCPLCNQPVPVRRGEDPNIKVDQHIRDDCKSEAAKKLYTNRCSYKGCKKKEVVQVKCNTCRKTYCLKHRHEIDHACEGVPNRLGQKSTSAARKPPQSTSAAHKPPQSTTLSTIGAELNRARQERHRHEAKQAPPPPQSASNVMSEDEALAAAIAASLAQSPAVAAHNPAPVPDQDEDEALARAIAASLQDPDSSRQTPKSVRKKEDSDTCTIS